MSTFSKAAIALLSITTLLTIAPPIVQAEQFLCVVEKSSGLKFNKQLKEWETTTFKADNKYILATAKNGKCWPDRQFADAKCFFLVTKLGEAESTIRCKEDFNEPGYLDCSEMNQRFFFNKKNGRFLYSYTLGYVNVIPDLNEITDETSDTPFIEIGRCSPFTPSQP